MINDKSKLSKVNSYKKLKPHRGDKNIAVGEANAEGVNVTHGGLAI